MRCLLPLGLGGRLGGGKLPETAGRPLTGVLEALDGVLGVGLRLLLPATFKVGYIGYIGPKPLGVNFLVLRFTSKFKTLK